MVYSKYELAINAAQQRVDDLERDLYLCCVNYPSGCEFVLKDKLPKGFSYIEKIDLPFNHNFRLQKNALREAYKFEAMMGITVKVERKTVKQNGYTRTSHYKLCLA